jgi:hypothetical protein
MRLLEQFRVQGPDGVQHSVACWLDTGLRTSDSILAPSIAIERYRLDGHQEVIRLDDDRYQALDGTVLRRIRPAVTRFDGSAA